MITLKESLIKEFDKLVKNDSEIRELIKSSSLDEGKLSKIFIEILNSKQKYMDNNDHPDFRDSANGVINFVKQSFNENQ